MPIPGGEITTTEIWNTPAAAEEANIPFEKIEEPTEDLTEEQKLEIALKMHKGEL